MHMLHRAGDRARKGWATCAELEQGMRSVIARIVEKERKVASPAASKGKSGHPSSIGGCQGCVHYPSSFDPAREFNWNTQ